MSLNPDFLQKHTPASNQMQKNLNKNLINAYNGINKEKFW